MNRDFRDQVAFVTGGGGGIGRAISLALAAQGVSVGVADINETSARAVVDEIVRQGGSAITLGVDVASKIQVDEAVSRLVREYGRLDVAVNNAGVGHVSPLLEIEPEEWDRVFAINARSVLFGIQASARVMIAQQIQGRIINIGSVAGRSGRPLLAAYAASKAAVINLTQSSAQALAAYQITCNCICPGVVSTPLGARALADMKEYVAMGHAPASQSQVPPAPLGAEATPEDIARMVIYLSGSGGSYITAQAFNIDGGRCMN